MQFKLKFLQVLFMVLLCNFMYGQNLKLELADGYMELFHYEKATEIYEDVIRKYPDNYRALKGMAVSYIKLQDGKNAERILLTMDSLKLSQSDDLLLLAGAQKSNGHYDDALVSYKKYSTLFPGNELVQAYVNEGNWAHKINRDSALFSLKNSKINCEYSDFAPCYYKQSILFSSARAEGSKNPREYSWNQQAYLNLYKAGMTLDSNLINPEVLDKDINSRFHEGTASYDSVNNLLYVTRNNFNKGTKTKGDEGYLNLAIYTTSDVNGGFEDLVPFKYNNENYSVGHPSLAPDRKTLYFTSDMPGGKGGTDIYKCNWVDDEWSKPENLGSPINTIADEMFPYVHTSGILYFSSNGHIGLGGMDLHSVDLNNENSKVSNAGYPLNSAYDDIGVIFDENEKSGFFSSNRPGGIGDDDIYKFFISKPEFITISGKVIDEETTELIEDASIYLQDENDSDSFEIVTTSNEKGEYTFTVPYQQIYNLKGYKLGYSEDIKKAASSPTTSFIDDLDFRLSKYDFLVKGHVILASDGIPLEGAKLTLLDETGAVISEKVTGEDGYYYFGLDKDHVYRITCELEGYALQSTSCDTRDRESFIFEHDFKMFKLEIGVTVQLDNIYYDFNKANIRPDAAKELDKLVVILEENPSMKIELRSHTDSRGSAPYNLSLSRRRAKSAVEYIISRGIVSSRLTSKGFGESDPLNRCVDGVKCTEEEFQFNRRTEFTILDI